MQHRAGTALYGGRGKSSTCLAGQGNAGKVRERQGLADEKLYWYWARQGGPYQDGRQDRQTGPKVEAVIFWNMASS